MSRRIKSTYRPKERRDDQGYPRAVGPVYFQQPGDKQPQQEKPLTKSQDIILGQEKKDEGASSLQVGYMCRRIRSTYRPKERGDDQGYPRAVGPVFFQQPGDKQPQQEKPLTKSQDIILGQEEKDEGASSVQVGNMSRRIKSTYRPKERRDDQRYPRAVWPVFFQQPGDKQPQQEKPLTKSQDIILGQEEKDEGASSVQGPALEANQQELAQPKTGCGCGDGSDVKRKRLPNPEPIKEPEAGEGQPQV
ncbi:P antigen family member 1-like [Lagenorhynchus albirostris]|uniref:P antigen family member 1-like n=2 Tax=Delphinidae TaxID=9726 RepID=UPI0028E3DC8A|nr:P antigen family member 1-like [Lagenorhynchus albirostris]